MRTIESIQPNEVVHCATKEQDQAFRELLHNAGKAWCSGASYLELSYFGVNKPVCYYVANDSWAHLSYFEENGHTITPASEFLPPVIKQSYIHRPAFVSPFEGETMQVETIGSQVVIGYQSGLDEVRELVLNRRFTNLQVRCEKGFQRMGKMEFHEIRTVQFVCRVGKSFHWVDRDSMRIIITEVSNQ